MGCIRDLVASSTKTLNATIPPRPVAMVYDPSQTAWTVAEERVLEEQLSLSSCAPSHELAIELLVRASAALPSKSVRDVAYKAAQRREALAAGALQGAGDAGAESAVLGAASAVGAGAGACKGGGAGKGGRSKGGGKGGAKGGGRGGSSSKSAGRALVDEARLEAT